MIPQDTNRSDDDHTEVTLESENSVANMSMTTEHKQTNIYDLSV